jgi:Domain of unknown function (DUF4386)
MTPRMQRLVAIGGLVFVVLVAASIVVSPNPPDAHASVTKVVSYYHNHRHGVLVESILITLAVFVGVFFFWYLREHLSTNGTNRSLATAGFAGALLFAASGGIAAGTDVALSDAANHVDPAVMQMLSVLQTDLANPLTDAGVAVFLFATGIVLIRGGSLPRWLGWVGVVFAVASLTPFQLSLPAIGLWILIACIVMLVRPRQPQLEFESITVATVEAVELP